MVGSESADYFMLRLGTPHPTWALTDDSNMIGIGNRDGVVSALFELDRNQIARIRALGQSVENQVYLRPRGRELHFISTADRCLRRVGRSRVGRSRLSADRRDDLNMDSTDEALRCLQFPSVSARVVASVSPA